MKVSHSQRYVNSSPKYFLHIGFPACFFIHSFIMLFLEQLLYYVLGPWEASVIEHEPEGHVPALLDLPVQPQIGKKMYEKTQVSR